MLRPDEVLSSLWLPRQSDAGLVNKLFNHEAIFPHVNFGQAFPLDLTALVKDRNNYVFADDTASVVFHRRLPGIFEMHTAILPGHRGQLMIEGARQAFWYMFTQTECVEILTHCPIGNTNAKAGARLAGFRHLWTGDKIYPQDGTMIDSEIYGMTIYDWAQITPYADSVGEWFHHRLADEYARIGKTLGSHSHDRNHNRYVGVAVAMIAAGQIYKGVSIYNRWAAMNLHPFVIIVSVEPLVIDIHDVKLRICRDDMEIVQCQ